MKKESNQSELNDYLLPDGNKINIAPGLIEEAAEILFQPNKVGLEYPGVQDLIMQSM